MDFELFVIPFLSGLCLALLLPVLGCYLRLRGEWLAALAYTHVAAAGALIGLMVGLAPLWGGLLAAASIGLGKHGLARRLADGAAYPLLLMSGWAISILLAANSPLAERLGHALFDGQLYFAGTAHLLGLASWLLLALFVLLRLSNGLLLSLLYPDFYRLRGQAAWPVVTGFDLLAALTVAMATMTLGVMGSFALIFVTPWLAFRQAQSWRRSVLLAALIGVLAYTLAFALALGMDQPFGPVLAIVLALLAVLWPV